MIKSKKLKIILRKKMIIIFKIKYIINRYVDLC